MSMFIYTCYSTDSSSGNEVWGEEEDEVEMREARAVMADQADEEEEEKDAMRKR